VYLALDGTLLYANPAFLRLVQLDPASLLTEHCFQDFLTRGGAIFYETQFAPTLLMRGLLNEISMDLVRKDTHRIPVLLNAVVSRDLNTPLSVSPSLSSKQSSAKSTRTSFSGLAESWNRSLKWCAALPTES
jgi:PAS domain-containing protein